MANAADEMNFSAVSSSQRPTPVDFETAISSSYGQNGSYQLNDITEEMNEREGRVINGDNGFSGNLSPWRTRELWLPSTAASTADDFCLDRFEGNKRGTSSSTINNRIMAMDRPSHWGSKPKCSRKSDIKAQQLLKEKNKKSRIESSPRGKNIQNNSSSSSGNTKAGMIAQFPLSKINSDAGKLNTTSFKPAWLQNTKPMITFHTNDMSRGIARNENGVLEEVKEDRIVDITESDINFTGPTVSRDKNSTGNINFSPLVSRSLSMSGDSRKDRQHSTYGDYIVDITEDIDRQQMDHTTSQIQIGRQTSEWRSPGHLKSSKNGKKSRAKAGSLQAIYQKLIRNIEEKECRMLNVTESLNDPLDPRNRALSALDVCVVSMIEMWPFKIAECCVRAFEIKIPKGPKRLDSVKAQYHPSQHSQIHSHSMQESMNQVSNAESGVVIENGLNGVDHVDCPDLQQMNFSLAQSLDVTNGGAESVMGEINQQSFNNGFNNTENTENTAFMNKSSNWLPSNDLQYTGRDDYTVSVRNNHLSTVQGISEVTFPSTLLYPDTNSKVLTRKNTTIQELKGRNIDENHPYRKLLTSGTYVSVYFRADTFKESLSLMSGAVIRIYDPEILSEYGVGMCGVDKGMQSDRGQTGDAGAAIGYTNTNTYTDTNDVHDRESLGVNVDGNNESNCAKNSSNNTHDQNNHYDDLNTLNNPSTSTSSSASRLGYTLHNNQNKSITDTPIINNVNNAIMSGTAGLEGVGGSHVDRSSQNASFNFNPLNDKRERSLLKIICTRLYDIRT